MYKINKYFKISLVMIMTFAFAAVGFAYVGDNYTTPDSWRQHATPNGIKRSINGLDFGDNGTLKINATTRFNLRANADDLDYSVYEYIRLRYADAKLANGTVNLNLNARLAYDSTPENNLRQFDRFRDGFMLSSMDNGFDWRIYQANVEFNKVVPLTDIDLGRIYLTTFDNYKIDGANVNVAASEYFNFNIFGGLPVSYYSDLHTYAVGASFAIPIEASGTKIQGEYTYFSDYQDTNKYTHVAKLRLDQAIRTAPVNGNVYAQADMIGKALLYDVGFNLNVDASKTGIKGYVSGQGLTNDEGDYVNPYVALYEDIFGSTKYVMGGVRFTQGIKDFLMIGVGYEGRYNMSVAYGDRNYHRVYGNIDLIGLIHKNNYLSLIVNYYDVAATRLYDRNTQVLAGLQMTQVFTDQVEAWLGVNVTNNGYRRSSILKNNPTHGEYAMMADFYGKQVNENTTVAYVGVSYQPVKWFILVADYTFEYADVFKSYDFQPDVHTVSLWANFIW